MERLSTYQLRQKDVVNICDGAVLGCPSDFEFDVKEGRITAIIIARPRGFFGLCRDDDIVIPWCKIECIGEDTILVRLTVEECRRIDDGKKRSWKL